MELIKFTNQLGGKDPSQPPFRIPAKDLDSNFAKLRPLPTDGNARQYAVEETPEGWFLRLFPDSNGVVGDVEEAPEDGQTYGRNNGAWVLMSVFPAPPASGTYVLGSQNGTIVWLATENCL